MTALQIEFVSGLVSRGRTLLREDDTSPELLKILEELGRVEGVTRDLLRRTDAGRFAVKARKRASDPQAQAVAAALVDKWKSELRCVKVEEPVAKVSREAVVLHTGLRVQEVERWCVGEPAARLQEILTREGVVVVPGVISPADAAEFRAGIEAALTACNPRWADSAKTAPTPGTRGHGLMKLYGIALSVASQKLRCHGGVRRVFEALYGTPDLVVSVDAPAVVTLDTLRERKRRGLLAGTAG